ncbi:unnamed protein product, partial [marine sediment metagenome]
MAEMCYIIAVVEEINLFFTLHYHSGMLGFFTKKQGFTLIELERSKSVRRNESFTLIELLVVLAIIGLLISVIVVSFGP